MTLPQALLQEQPVVVLSWLGLSLLSSSYEESTMDMVVYVVQAVGA
jgi:hypothetical protein